MEWFNKDYNDVVDELNSDIENGLNDKIYELNKEKYGTNELNQTKKKSWFIKFLEQFKDFMIIILLIAALISGIIGKIKGEGITDSIIILIVVIVNAIIGVAQENKAEKSLEALKKLSSYTAKTIRNGELIILPSSDLVPGDIVIFETGDYVPADIRIIEANNLKANESALTGESTPVEKDNAKIESTDVGIADRINMLFSSSLITYGRGKGIVVETGMKTEVGKIAEILENTEKEATPLQKKLNSLGKWLGIASIIICAIIFFMGLIYKMEPIDMFMTAVSLAVAVIPEGLVAVSTIVLAIGVQRMVKKNAIIKKLPAVESLGSSTVICSDKTGTLTQNKMTVQQVFFDKSLEKIESLEEKYYSESKEVDVESNLNRLVHISMLCNDIKIDTNNNLSGDPTEAALIDMGFKLNFNSAFFSQYPRVEEIPFDSDRKLMTTVHKSGKKYLVYTKGGVDEILKRCNSYIVLNEIKTDLNMYSKEILKNNELMANSALRVLAMAYKEMDHLPSKNELEKLESDLIFVGMVGMIDPPRKEAREAVLKCKKAGIKTVMITGDHKITAVAIAKELGILEDEKDALTGIELEKMSDDELYNVVERIRVYARVSPEHKVRIVNAFKKHNEVVAMTGDGVNDAPALKSADIGCAMGMVGTDVAKEAADVILTDDNFATLVTAVEEGRRIYDNILKAIQFLLSSNIGEVIIILLTMLLAPLLSKKFGIELTMIEALLPIHILWINLVTDSLPALALATDPANKDIMERKPVKHNKTFSKGMFWRIMYQGITIGLVTFAAFIIGLATNELPVIEGLSEAEVRLEIAKTMTFVVLAFSELIHVFNIRNNKESIFKTGIGGNSKLFLAIFVSAMLMVVVLVIPVLRELFRIPLLPTQNIIEMVVLIFIPMVVVEIFKLFKINTINGE